MTVTPPSTVTVRGLSVNRVHLQHSRGDDGAPYALALDTSCISQMPSMSNFLATQVWPSARVAARLLQNHGCGLLLEKSGVPTVCELGCGPGLPSITLAASHKVGNTSCALRVIATDLDEFALDLVKEAAKEQKLDDVISTRVYDLISASWDGSWMDEVDLWIMSDVFESGKIAEGAAKLTYQILSRGSKTGFSTGPVVWVFAQSDRAQREIFMEELRRLVDETSSDSWSPSLIESTSSQLHWSALESYDPSSRLWLFDLDETRVDYGS